MRLFASCFCRQNTDSHDTFLHVQLITVRTAQIHHANMRGSISLTCVPTIYSLTVLSFLDWIKKPCKIYGGVANTLNLHLPQIMSPR